MNSMSAGCWNLYFLPHLQNYKLYDDRATRNITQFTERPSRTGRHAAFGTHDSYWSCIYLVKRSSINSEWVLRRLENGTRTSKLLTTGRPVQPWLRAMNQVNLALLAPLAQWGNRWQSHRASPSQETRRSSGGCSWASIPHDTTADDHGEWKKTIPQGRHQRTSLNCHTRISTRLLLWDWFLVGHS